MASYDDFGFREYVDKAPQTVDDLIAWLNEGRAEAYEDDRYFIVSWGLGSGCNRYVHSKRDVARIKRSVRLVEGRISRERRQNRSRWWERRYAAEGHQTWEDKHDFHGIGHPENWA